MNVNVSSTEIINMKVNNMGLIVSMSRGVNMSLCVSLIHKNY